jgi:hypothetical protein
MGQFQPLCAHFGTRLGDWSGRKGGVFFYFKLFEKHIPFLNLTVGF